MSHPRLPRLALDRPGPSMGDPLPRCLAALRHADMDDMPMGACLAARHTGMDDITMGARLAMRQPDAATRLCGMPRMMAGVPPRRGGDAAAGRWCRDPRNGPQVPAVRGRTGAGLGGPRGAAAVERPALVAEIIGHVSRRGEVRRPRRRLDGASRQARHGGGKRDADGERQRAKAPAQIHRLPSFSAACHSAKLIRSIRNRSLVRAYQPRPCMRPTRRILSVAT